METVLIIIWILVAALFAILVLHWAMRLFEPAPRPTVHRDPRPVESIEAEDGPIGESKALREAFPGKTAKRTPVLPQPPQNALVKESWAAARKKTLSPMPGTPAPPNETSEEYNKRCRPFIKVGNKNYQRSMLQWMLDNHMKPPGMPYDEYVEAVEAFIYHRFHEATSPQPLGSQSRIVCPGCTNELSALAVFCTRCGQQLRPSRGASKK